MSTATEPVLVRRVDADVRLELLSHGIRVYGFNYRGRDALLDFCRSCAAYGVKRIPGGRFVKSMLKVYVGVTADRREFHFHRHQYAELIYHLRGWGFADSRISVEARPMYDAADVELTLVDKRDPRDDQVPKIEYLAADGATKVLTVDPGRGKTFMTLMAQYRIGKLTLYVIKAMYIKKWIGDLKQAFGFDVNDIMVIRGAADLKALTALALTENLDCKTIICSNTTFMLYLKDYERYGDRVRELGFACVPDQFCELLKVGLRVIDEVHQDFHLNFRQDVYTHVPKTISLSGTLESDDPFMNSRYEVMFPKELRIDNGARVVYTAVKALEYRFKRQNLIKFINKSRGSYSQVVYEQSIMKNAEVLSRYKEMVGQIAQHYYMEKKQDGQKMLIYAATVEMCTILAEYLKKLFPVLNVQRYVSEDDFDEMLTADMVVSTLKSLGTAQDIPDLYLVLMTDGLGSRQANLQAFGRLREMLRYPGCTPVFLYLVNLDIPKQIEYHTRKETLFKGRVVGHQVVTTPFAI